MASLDNPWEYKDFWHQFNGRQENNEEIEFWDDQVSEYFGVYGIPLKYFPTDANKNSDRVFGEDTTQRRERVVHLTGLIEGGMVEENLLFNTFGQLNQVQFVMYVHIPTFVEHVGRKPLPSDQFTFVNDVTTMVFEVNHIDETTLGHEGNFFGYRSCYILNCRERELTQPIVGDGERFGVTDLQGNLLPDIPEDALVDDGSGRVREKYSVPGMRNPDGTLRGDNDYIQNVADGVDEEGNDVLPEGKGIVSRSGDDKPDWGDW
jgi:hypothetical protein